MFKRLGIISISLVIAAAAVFPATSPNKARAAVSNWQNGVSIQPAWNGDFGSDSFKQSVSNAAADHANYITLIVPIFQSNIYSTDIQNGWNTPTDASLVSAIQYIHSKGMRVMIKIHLDTYDGQWRANINPGDRNNWFRNYGNFLNHYGQLAAQNGVEEISVGSELISMAADYINTTNTQNWINLINNLREIYGGKLTYSSNWGPSGFVDEKDNINFWGSLDYISISAYFELTHDYNNNVSFLTQAWNQWQPSIAALNQRFGKPVLFTEIGYRSIDGAHTQPWSYTLGGGYNGTEQQNDYEALFEYWNNYSYMVGVHFWQWQSDPNAGWPGDTSYTPQHKPAEGTMSNWFSQGGEGPTPLPPPPPPSNISFSASASVSPGSPQINQNAAITVNVTDTSGTLSNGLVDVEVHNSSNAKVFQQVFQNQNFNSGQTLSFTSNTSFGNADTYHVSVGVFGTNWNPVYYWNDTAVSFSVSGSQPPPGSFTSSASVSGNPQAGQSATITSNVTDTGGAANVIIDTEVFNSSGLRVFQNAVNQNFGAGQTVQINSNWTPGAAGTYTVKIGIFGNNWTPLINWNDNATTVNATRGSSPPSAGNLQIWWPTNGAWVSGTQPFKIFLENIPNSNYTAWWQVDTGGLNPMYDSNDGYPHKEALVDLSGWTWKGTGPYTLTFTAKDTNGNILKQNSVNINVSH